LLLKVGVGNYFIPIMKYEIDTYFTNHCGSCGEDGEEDDGKDATADTDDDTEDL